MRSLPLNRAILGHALLLGIAGDALLGGRPGFGFPIWTAVLSLATVSLAMKAGQVVSGQAAAWLATAVIFSSAVAWRDAEMLVFLNASVTLAAFGMAAISLSDSRRALFAPRLRDTVWAGGVLFGSLVAGIAPLLLRGEAKGADIEKVERRRFLPALRATVLAGSLVLVFGALLRADPLFASFVTLPNIDVEPLLEHAVAIGFLTWTVGGWARGALVARTDSQGPPDELPFGLGLLDITAALGSLTVLFTAFVATQLGWFFGGEQFLQERTGLTAAEYARKGFFQMVWVALLVVGVLLATRAALRPGKGLALRHTALSLPLIALLGAIIASAVMRMRLYVHYYGLTTDRLYTLVFRGPGVRAGIHGMAGRRGGMARHHRAPRLGPSLRRRRRRLGTRDTCCSQCRFTGCLDRPDEHRTLGTAGRLGPAARSRAPGETEWRGDQAGRRRGGLLAHGRPDQPL